MRILLADDSADDAFLFTDACRAQHPDDEVTQAATAEAALKQIGANGPAHFDLVVLDYHLPGATAPGVLEKLRAAGFRGPVAVWSSLLAEADRQRVLECGANFAGEKPSDLAALWELVSRLRTLVA